MRLLSCFFVLAGLNFASASLPITELRDQLSSGAVLALPGEPLYINTTRIDNGAFDNVRPLFVVFPLVPEDVQATLAFARQYDLPYATRGGGHGAEGYCLVQDGVVLNTQWLNKTTVHPETNTFTIQAGVVARQAFAALKEAADKKYGGRKALNFPADPCNTVGLVGYLQGGGMNLPSRTYGLGSDSLLAVKLVTADGKIVTLAKRDLDLYNQAEQDLWWALQGGGGGNFGVVLEMTLQAYETETSTMLAGQLCWPLGDNTVNLLGFYNTWIETLPNQLSVYLVVNNISLCMQPIYNGRFEDGLELIQPLLNWIPAPTIAGGGGIPSLNSSYYNCNNPIFAFEILPYPPKIPGHKIKSFILPAGSFTPTFNEAIHWSAAHAKTAIASYLVLHQGGAILDKSQTETAFWHREKNLRWVFEAYVGWDQGSKEQEQLAVTWVEQIGKVLQAASLGPYLNDIDAELPTEEYYGGNFPRLRRTKSAWDPENFFRFKQSIPPLAVDENAEAIRKQVELFQLYQVNKDARSAAALFVENGVVSTPSGSTPTRGRDNIQKHWEEYFATIVSNFEETTSEILVANNFATFSKLQIPVRAADGCIAIAPTINWLRFEPPNPPGSRYTVPPKIVSMDAVWNTTAQAKQCPPLPNPIPRRPGGGLPSKADVAKFKKSLSAGAVAVQDGEALYVNATDIDNGRFDGVKPFIVVYASVPQDIKTTMDFAKKYALPFRVRGGGHSAEGYCLVEGGVVLDTAFWNASYIDNQHQILTVGAGAHWYMVYDHLEDNWKNGSKMLMLPGGACSTVGVSGYTLGGGWSFLSRSYGLLSDSLLEVKLVTAAGEFITVSRAESFTYGTKKADLWWALQGGGGGNFGVVVEMKFQLYQLPAEDMLAGQLCWPSGYQSLDVIQFYNDWIETVPFELAVYGMLRNDTFCLTPVYNGHFDEGVQLIEPLLKFKWPPGCNNVPPPCNISTFKTNIYDYERKAGGTTEVSGRKAKIKSGILPAYSMTRTLAEALHYLGDHAGNADTTILWMHQGGRMLDITQTATAFWHREQDLRFVFEAKAEWVNDSDAHYSLDWAERFGKTLDEWAIGYYLNYIDDDITLEQYYGGNLPRLMKTKLEWDPDNFFNFRQSIPPLDPSVYNGNLIKQQVELFQKYQISMDASAAANLFIEKGVVSTPAGGTPVIGRANIQKNWENYFATITSNREQETSEILVSNNYATFTKLQMPVRKADGCVAISPTVNWLVFEAPVPANGLYERPPRIVSFEAVWNLAAKSRQCPPPAPATKSYGQVLM